MKIYLLKLLYHYASKWNVWAWQKLYGVRKRK